MDLPPLSNEGLRAAIEVAHEFNADLVDEAGRVAKRHLAQQASPEHVKIAAQHLYQNKSGRREQAMAAAGALIAGISGSAMFSFLVADKPNVVAVTISAAATVAGSVVTALGLSARV